MAKSLSSQQIAAGNTTGSFSVAIMGDTTKEANETFSVTVSQVSGASTADGYAVGTISNDDRK